MGDLTSQFMGSGEETCGLDLTPHLAQSQTHKNKMLNVSSISLNSKAWPETHKPFLSFVFHTLRTKELLFHLEDDRIWNQDMQGTHGINFGFKILVRYKHSPYLLLSITHQK